MKRTLFAGAIAIVIASPAFAADLPAAPPAQAPAAYVPVAPPVYNWSGIYIGANAGGLVVQPIESDKFHLVAGGTSSGQSFNDSGFAAGGQLGANFQSGQLVFGIEGDADYLSQ